MDLKVYLETAYDRQLIIRIDHGGQDKAWHTVSSNLPVGNYSLVFEALFAGQQSTDYIGIDSISVTEEPCKSGWKIQCFDFIHS